MMSMIIELGKIKRSTPQEQGCVGFEGCRMPASILTCVLAGLSCNEGWNEDLVQKGKAGPAFESTGTSVHMLTHISTIKMGQKKESLFGSICPQCDGIGDGTCERRD